MAISVAYVAWLARSASLLPLLSWQQLSVAGALAFAAAMAVFLAVQSWLSNHAGAPMPEGYSMFTSNLRGLVDTSVARPALFGVAHVVFWGPWILLFMAWLPRVFAFSKQHLALYLCISLFAVFLLVSESRIATYFLPMAVFALCGAIDRHERGISMPGTVVIFVLSLAYSRFWLPMASGPYGNLLEFPAQLYLLHFGPRMGTTGYFLGLAQTIVAALVLSWAVRRRHSSRRPTIPRYSS